MLAPVVAAIIIAYKSKAELIEWIIAIFASPIYVPYKIIKIDNIQKGF